MRSQAGAWQQASAGYYGRSSAVILNIRPTRRNEFCSDRIHAVFSGSQAQGPDKSGHYERVGRIFTEGFRSVFPSPREIAIPRPPIPSCLRSQVGAWEPSGGRSLGTGGKLEPGSQGNMGIGGTADGLGEPAARKKSPRKGSVPGGQRTHIFSGSDWIGAQRTTVGAHLRWRRQGSPRRVVAKHTRRLPCRRPGCFVVRRNAWSGRPPCRTAR